MRLTDEGKNINDPMCLPNVFNDYFSSFNKSNDSVRQREYRNECVSVQESMYFYPVTEDKLISLAKRKKNSHSGGHDEVPHIIVKKVMYATIVKPLVFLFNASLTEGVFPDCYKLAKVIPIFKKGSPLDKGNYRPVSLQSTFCKYLEGVVYNRLVAFCDKHDGINNNQLGFRSKHDIVIAMSQFTNYIYQQVDSKERVAELFLDVSRAFDTVDYTLLLNILEQYDARGVCYKWFYSYPANRQQFVQVGAGGRSETVNTSLGIHQGSVLAPYLFYLLTT